MKSEHKEKSYETCAKKKKTMKADQKRKKL